MENRSKVVLRQKKTGLYFGYKLQKTKELFEAWRWKDQQELDMWLEYSIYSPCFKDEYEPVEVEMTIEIKE